jgi:hypothetical protein
VSRDVFEEHPAGLHFSDDAGNVWPQVPFIGLTAALSCCAERLAWVSGKDGVNGPAQFAPVECGNIVPDWCWGEVSGPLGCNDALAGFWLPLDKASRVEVRLGQHEAHIKATGPRA